MWFSFDDPLMAAQQLLGKETNGDLERQTTTPCAVGGLQQDHVFDSTLCGVSVSRNLNPFVLGPYGSEGLELQSMELQ